MTVANFGDSVLTITWVDLLVVAALVIVIGWLARRF